jgi:hypothetical protein
MATDSGPIAANSTNDRLGCPAPLALGVPSADIEEICAHVRFLPKQSSAPMADKTKLLRFCLELSFLDWASA